jgi:hypothetical protein
MRKSTIWLYIYRHSGLGDNLIGLVEASSHDEAMSIAAKNIINGNYYESFLYDEIEELRNELISSKKSEKALLKKEIKNKEAEYLESCAKEERELFDYIVIAEINGTPCILD